MRGERTSGVVRGKTGSSFELASGSGGNGSEKKTPVGDAGIVSRVMDPMASRSNGAVLS